MGKGSKKWTYFVGLVVIIVGLAGPSTIYAQEPPTIEETIAIITSPANGSTISGQVPIIGSAGHPAAFAYYDLEYANMLNPADIWLPIAENITQQITEGTLGIWNTVGRDGDTIADGQYQIRLRVFLTDPDLPPVEFIVTNLTLVNTEPTPLPTISTEAAPTLGPSVPTDGPTPTPRIEQPITNTPRPTLSAIRSSENAASTTEDDDPLLSMSEVQNAFCVGSLLALSGFGILAAYLWLRQRVRYS